MRKDFWKLSLLYLETMSVTGILYTGATYTNDRYRPYAYDERTEFEYRRRGGAKNSFYAGHVALVATSTFFFAQVYSDYHPDSKIKWLFYTGAGAATAFTGYMRYYSGQHFPSDLLLGVTQGTLTGILVPRLHRTKFFKENNISLRPFATGQSNGLAVVYKFK
jgi:membrane-associated phospholipid phosphatase